MFHVLPGAAAFELRLCTDCSRQPGGEPVEERGRQREAPQLGLVTDSHDVAPSHGYNSSLSHLQAADELLYKQTHVRGIENKVHA